MEQTYTIDNFTLTIDNFMTKEQCDKMINVFETYDKLNLTWNREYQSGTNSHKISDRHVYSQDMWTNEKVKTSVDFLDIGLVNDLATAFWERAYPTYISKYSILNDYPKHENKVIKIQKTEVGGEGYHVWHSEDASHRNKHRILTWILYLNDVEYGGETEFIYLSKRVEARTGRLVIFPGGFTHTHRGNPPLSNKKYIATGWVEMS
jgi:hypothetical protein